jgi:hypothetical protein
MTYSRWVKPVYGAVLSSMLSMSSQDSGFSI